ncbi:MAG: hypothetical protein DRH26_18200 [Deltaproteobacteria bacterium]|nr:MAG: hypothetical protein DRH26_18200 [Deltaproteobacteria bacterium]
MPRPIKRFIDVEIRKDTPRVSAAGFSVLMVITDSDLLSTTVRNKSFLSAAAVDQFFGDGTEESLAADAFFFQDPFLTDQPHEMQFGRYVDASIAALIECGSSPETTVATWNLVSDGEFVVTIDGGAVSLTALDFTLATSLDDVATVIDTALGANGDCYFLINRFNINSGTTGAASTITVLDTVAAPAGTDISGSAYLDGDIVVSPTNLGGSILSQGQVAETVETAITNIEDANDDWYAMGALKKYRDTTDAEDMVDEIESRRKMFLIATNDSNTLVLNDTSTFMYYIKNLNYKRSGGIYHDNATLYPDMSWMGQQLPKDVGSTNWAFKELAGIPEGAEVTIPAVALTELQKDAALNVNCNVYTSTLSADFVYLGTMGGGKNIDKEGEFIDIIRNIDFLQARTEEGLMSLLLEKEIIPFTNAGITMVDTRLKSRLDQYGVKQGILVDGSITTYFPKRSEVDQSDRDDRLLPDGTFTAELQGGINKIVVRGTVYV